MSKKDKKALAMAKLDDLDDLLGQFGVSADANAEGDENKDEEEEKKDEATEGGAGGEGASKKKKKKKKGKKKGGAATEGSDDWVKVDTPAEGADADKQGDATVDVAAVLKSKSKGSKKSTSEIAAAAAAKDAKEKAKKKAEADKKKKKKQNKVSCLVYVCGSICSSYLSHPICFKLCGSLGQVPSAALKSP